MSSRLLKSSLIVILGLALAVMTCACSAYQSVAHMNRTPWAGNNVPSTLTAKYLTFSFSGALSNGVFTVSGTVRPIKDTVPEWVQHLDHLDLTVYLTDPKGRVLARASMSVPPALWDSGQEMPFVLKMNVDSSDTAGRTEISFGYRMLLTEKTSSPRQDCRTFFATETALNMYP